MLTTIPHTQWYLCTLYIPIYVPCKFTHLPSTVIQFTTPSLLGHVMDMWLKPILDHLTDSSWILIFSCLFHIMLSCSCICSWLSLTDPLFAWNTLISSLLGQSRLTSWCLPCTNSCWSMFAFGPNLLLHLSQFNPVSRHWLLSSWPLCHFLLLFLCDCHLHGHSSCHLLVTVISMVILPIIPCHQPH